MNYERKDLRKRTKEFAIQVIRMYSGKYETDLIVPVLFAGG